MKVVITEHFLPVGTRPVQASSKFLVALSSLHVHKNSYGVSCIISLPLQKRKTKDQRASATCFRSHSAGVAALVNATENLSVQPATSHCLWWVPMALELASNQCLFVTARTMPWFVPWVCCFHLLYTGIRVNVLTCSLPSSLKPVGQTTFCGFCPQPQPCESTHHRN